MKSKWLVVLAMLVAFVASYPAFGQDYRAEIMEKMIDPCYWSKVKDSKLTEYLGPRKAVEFMKTLNQKQVESAVQSALSMVKGKPLDQRTVIYDFGLQVCVKGITGK